MGICVALADKLETLVGMFGIGQIPTGDKDPFALRRHALGIVRILIEANLPLDLDSTLMLAIQGLNNDEIWYAARDRDLVNKIEQKQTGAISSSENLRSLIRVDLQAVVNFIFDRLTGYLRDQEFTVQEIDAVLALKTQFLGDIPKRLAAVRAFAALPEAAALAAANKRVGNILKKTEGDFALRQAQGERIEINVALLQEPAEQALHQALSKITTKADSALASGDYTATLSALAALRIPVDEFFDNVMVNAEDMALRANRLALLSQLHQAMNRIADISKLAT